jgi:hypothetical protein
MAKDIDLKNIKLSDLTKYFQDLNHRPFLISALVLIATLVAGVVYGIVPEVRTIISDQNKIATATSALTRLNKKLASVKAAVSDSDFATKVELVDQILYSENPMLPMMYALDETTKYNQISSSMLTQWEFSPGLVATPSAAFSDLRQGQASAAVRASSQKDSEGFTSFVEIRANYYQLVSFLNLLELYSPFNSVAYAQITNNPISNDSGQFEILTQYYPPTLTSKLETEVPLFTQADRDLLEYLTQFNFPDLTDAQAGTFTDFNLANPFINNNI